MYDRKRHSVGFHFLKGATYTWRGYYRLGQGLVKKYRRGVVDRSREGVGHEVLSLVQGVGRAIFSYPQGVGHPIFY